MATSATAEPAAVWRRQWLGTCQGFRVESLGRSTRWRIGLVTGIRLDADGEPESLEVRTGLLSRRLLLIPVAQVVEILPWEQLLRLGAASHVP
jgi:hypothetical protein